MGEWQQNLEHFDIKAFQYELISWYQREKRDLPWRKDQDPYKVWVSEIMLQQTRVETVVPYFQRFMEKFPNVESLANADEEEVLKAWEGLGYYSRARNLHNAVKEVKEKYSGNIPDDPIQLGKLKGIGPYTKGAILSIAFNQPEPAVDGNVMRVLSRILAIDEDIAKPKTRNTFEEAVKKLISKENPSDFNQALMELGAMVCTPSSPSCLLCPVRDFCRGFSEGIQEQLPVKTKNKTLKNVSIAAAVLVNGNHLYIHKRPNEGLLANLWEFPNCEVRTSHISHRKLLEQFLNETYGIKAELSELKGTIQHVFSHLIWNISVYFGKVNDEKLINGLQKISFKEIDRYAFSVSHQKIWALYKEKAGNN